VDSCNLPFPYYISLNHVPRFANIVGLFLSERERERVCELGADINEESPPIISRVWRKFDFKEKFVDLMN
jgi:hypothetical protein